MKISEAVQFFKGQLDYGFGEEDQKAEEAMQVAIRSLEAWEKVDAEITESYNLRRKEDAHTANGLFIAEIIVNHYISEIEKGGSE